MQCHYGQQSDHSPCWCNGQIFLSFCPNVPEDLPSSVTETEAQCITTAEPDLWVSVQVSVQHKRSRILCVHPCSMCTQYAASVLSLLTFIVYLQKRDQSVYRHPYIQF